MSEKSVVGTYRVCIYMAGDIATAKQHLRSECWQRGLCVTVTPTDFIYTGGEEAGFAIGFVNYPRFPSEPSDLFERAIRIASELVSVCCQRSALVVADDKTEWVAVEAPGATGAT